MTPQDDANLDVLLSAFCWFVSGFAIGWFLFGLLVIWSEHR